MILSGNLTFDRSGEKLVIELGFTKSGKRCGRREKVVCTDDITILLMSLVVWKKPLGTRLLPRGLPEFRKSFARHVRAIGGDREFIKPYSLRRGGATAYFSEFGNMLKTSEKGRWRQVTTARLYVDEATAEASKMELTRGQERALARGRLWWNKVAL